MKTSLALVAIALWSSLGLAVGVPAHAQTAPVVTASPAQVDAHSDLYQAMTEGMDQALLMTNILGSIRKAWSSNTQMVIAERQYPGLFDAMLGAAEPVIRDTNETMVARFAPEYAAALRAVVTADEARELSAFYRSPMGIKLKTGLVENIDYQQTIQAGMHSRTLSESNIKQDLDAATARAVGGLTADDFAELERLAAAKPVLLKLQAVGEALMPVRMRMEQASLAPEYQKKLEVVMGAAAQKHVSRK